MVEINSVVLPSVSPTRVSKHVFLWFSNLSGHRNHLDGLVKKKKATLHGSNPRYTDLVGLWQDPRICIFNKQPGNSTTRGLRRSTMPYGCGGLRYSPLLPPSLIRYPDIVLRTKVKVLLGSPSLLVMSLMP